LSSEIEQRGRARGRAALAGFATALALLALPAGSAMATGGISTGGGSGTVAGDTAKLRANGQAVPPENAPRRVKRAIRAGNDIVGKPYFYGGGHNSGFRDSRGYDCSGAVSYVLSDRYGARVLDAPMPSSGFMGGWGRRGRGNWITTYASSGHMYVMVAGLRFESHTYGDGPSWSKQNATRSGYAVRHPRGL